MEKITHTIELIDENGNNGLPKLIISFHNRMSVEKIKQFFDKLMFDDRYIIGTPLQRKNLLIISIMKFLNDEDKENDVMNNLYIHTNQYTTEIPKTTENDILYTILNGGVIISKLIYRQGEIQRFQDLRWDYPIKQEKPIVRIKHIAMYIKEVEDLSGIWSANQLCEICNIEPRMLDRVKTGELRKRLLDRGFEVELLSLSKR